MGSQVSFPCIYHLNLASSSQKRWSTERLTENSPDILYAIVFVISLQSVCSAVGPSARQPPAGKSWPALHLSSIFMSVSLSIRYSSGVRLWSLSSQWAELCSSVGSFYLIPTSSCTSCLRRSMSWHQSTSTSTSSTSSSTFFAFSNTSAETSALLTLTSCFCCFVC